MADPLQPVRAGQPLDIDADTWNAFIAAARAHRGRTGGPPSGGPPAFPLAPHTTAIFKYDESSVETLAAHSVVTYGAPLTDVAADPHGASRRPGFVAGVPASAGDQVAVTLEPIAGQATGRAVTAGLAVARVDVTSAAHARAVPIAGDTDKFASAAAGGYPVVYKEGGTGEQWAVVLLGDRDSVRCEPYGAQIGPTVFDFSYHAGVWFANGYTWPTWPASATVYLHGGGAALFYGTGIRFTLAEAGLYEITAWVEIRQSFDAEAVAAYEDQRVGDVGVARAADVGGQLLPISRHPGVTTSRLEPTVGSTGGGGSGWWLGSTTFPFEAQAGEELEVVFSTGLYRASATSGSGRAGYNFVRVAPCGTYAASLSPPPPLPPPPPPPPPPPGTTYACVGGLCQEAAGGPYTDDPTCGGECPPAGGGGCCDGAGEVFEGGFADMTLMGVTPMTYEASGDTPPVRVWRNTTGDTYWQAVCNGGSWTLLRIVSGVITGPVAASSVDCEAGVVTFPGEPFGFATGFVVELAI